MANIVERTSQLPLQLFKEITDPLGHILPGSSLAPMQGADDKRNDEETKKETSRDLSRKFRPAIQSKGYIKYPVYDFF